MTACWAPVRSGHDRHGPVAEQRQHRRSRQQEREPGGDLRHCVETGRLSIFSVHCPDGEQGIAIRSRNLESRLSARARWFQTRNSAGGSSKKVALKPLTAERTAASFVEVRSTPNSRSASAFSYPKTFSAPVGREGLPDLQNTYGRAKLGPLIMSMKTASNCPSRILELYSWIWTRLEIACRRQCHTAASGSRVRFVPEREVLW